MELVHYRYRDNSSQSGRLGTVEWEH